MRHIATTSLRGMGRLYIAWAVFLILILAPFPWSSTPWVLSVLVVGLLTVGALTVHALLSIRRFHREARAAESGAPAGKR